MSIDPAALEPYREAMGESADSFVIDLIDTFLDSTPQLVTALYAAALSGDTKTFTRSAHTLKSNSAIFGASLLSGLSFELESIEKSTDLTTLQPQIDQLKAEYEQVCSELANLRQSLAD